MPTIQQQVQHLPLRALSYAAGAAITICILVYWDDLLLPSGHEISIGACSFLAASSLIVTLLTLKHYLEELRDRPDNITTYNNSIPLPPPSPPPTPNHPSGLLGPSPIAPPHHGFRFQHFGAEGIHARNRALDRVFYAVPGRPVGREEREMGDREWWGLEE